MRNQLLVGSCLDLLKTLPAESVQCCVTSPPYWNQRDYDVQGQIGMEETPELYVAKMVEVFHEVYRVLRQDGTCWVNLGDTYFSASPNNKGQKRIVKKHKTLKVKDLVGIPWLVAFGLQADGWYLRSDIIWAKSRVMPESVRDRVTRCHEYIFLLTKSDKYYYDLDAIREPFLGIADSELEKTEAEEEAQEESPFGRNKRSVWNINPKPYKGAHFAVFPEEIPRICIKAGTSERGACGTCGAPWQRVTKKVKVEAVEEYQGKWSEADRSSSGRRVLGNIRARRLGGADHNIPFPSPVTVGWKPSCKCTAEATTPCIVLDPFAGSGTTLAVAKWLGRDYLGMELNPEYSKLSTERLSAAHEHNSERELFDQMLGLEEEA